ncbi:MAG: alpha/beta fold hydrolase [Chromatiaceae bacterium]|nr:MAG: alpha/beta fold hydrolase [Chromatiaceae bacterium]
MFKPFANLLFALLRYLAIGLLGFVIGVILLYGAWLRSGPALEPWHRVELTEEFTANQAERIRTMEDYWALEERLFAELDAKIYDRNAAPTGAGTWAATLFPNREPDHLPEPLGEVSADPLRLERALLRYSPGSAADPRGRETNWNRSFELSAEAPLGSVLLLHGMSDSPYSLRALGEALHARGFTVLGLRLPGHGTAPSGLLRLTWEDLRAATRIGLRHLAATVSNGEGPLPIHVMGYSTGAALAVEAALDRRDDDTLPAITSLVLVSPAIGISPAAGVTRWLNLLSLFPGFSQAAWTAIMPEFDPFNYNSFSANAALQVHRVTRAVATRLRTLSAEAPLADFPPTLVLLSTVDTAVSPDAVVDTLFNRLAPDRHALVLYDINRFALTTPILVRDPAPFTDRLLADPGLPFTLTLVTNANADRRAMVALTKAPGTAKVTDTEPLAATWPADAISLSHVDPPFPPDDPLYGRCPPEPDGRVCFGGLALRGERGVIKIPAQWLMRLRYNPFYDYQERRVLDWVLAANGGGEDARPNVPEEWREEAPEESPEESPDTP